MANKTSKIEAEAPKKESNRRQFRNDEWTAEEVAAKRASLTVKELPEGWVKLAHVADEFRTRKIPVSRLVRATGGDRCMLPPQNPVFKVVYFSGARYLHPNVLVQGIALMSDTNFGKTPRKKKAKAEGDTEKKAPAKRRKVTAKVKTPATS